MLRSIDNSSYAPEAPDLYDVKEVLNHRRPGARASLDSFGTRHRSAARFALSVVDSLSFVVSQSGSARLFRHADGDVLLWAELDLRRFGD